MPADCCLYVRVRLDLAGKPWVRHTVIVMHDGSDGNGDSTSAVPAAAAVFRLRHEGRALRLYVPAVCGEAAWTPRMSPLVDRVANIRVSRGHGGGGRHDHQQEQDHLVVDALGALLKTNKTRKLLQAARVHAIPIE